MPTYDYKCEKCGATEERVVSISERKNQKCKCGNDFTLCISSPRITGMDSFGRSGKK